MKTKSIQQQMLHFGTSFAPSDTSATTCRGTPQRRTIQISCRSVHSSRPFSHRKAPQRDRLSPGSNHKKAAIFYLVIILSSCGWRKTTANVWCQSQQTTSDWIGLFRCSCELPHLSDRPWRFEEPSAQEPLHDAADELIGHLPLSSSKSSWEL